MPRIVTVETVVEGGTYTLVVELVSEVTLEVGALGTHTFEPGWYAYTGSALGAGGFARVDRHRELAAGDRETRHWHLDYLLGHDAASVDVVTTSAGTDAECAIASSVDGEPIPEFGCSDCRCFSHLHYMPHRAVLLDSVREAHRSPSRYS